MAKTYFKILLTVLLISLSLTYSQAAITISSGTVLNDSQLEIILNNQKVNYIALPYNNVLYVERNIFSSNSMNGEEVFVVSGKNYTCVPLFTTLEAYGVLYDYKKVYNKTMIIIITDPSLAQQYTSNVPNVNITVEEDDDIDYPWGLGLAVANTIHFFNDDDWYYVYRHNYVPDRFVFVGQNGTFVKGDDKFILNNDNRFFVKGEDGYVNVKKDNVVKINNNGNNYVRVNNNNVFYNHNGDNFGVFGNKENNVNINKENNININKDNNVNIDKNNINVNRDNFNIENNNFGGGEHKFNKKSGRVKKF